MCPHFGIDRAGDRRSLRILQELENIDDECDSSDIAFVKISEEAMLTEYDLDPLPTLVYFRNKFPQIFNGDLSKEEQVQFKNCSKNQKIFSGIPKI